MHANDTIKMQSNRLGFEMRVHNLTPNPVRMVTHTHTDTPDTLSTNARDSVRAHIACAGKSGSRQIQYICYTHKYKCSNVQAHEININIFVRVLCLCLCLSFHRSFRCTVAIECTIARVRASRSTISTATTTKTTTATTTTTLNATQRPECATKPHVTRECTFVRATRRADNATSPFRRHRHHRRAS